MAQEPSDRAFIPALRHATGIAFSQIGADELTKIAQRTRLLISVPALRMRMLDNFNSSVNMLAEAVAARTGRDQADLEIRTLAGAVTGAMIAAIFAWVEGGSREDLGELIDRVLAHLEAGLQLYCKRV